MEFQNPFRRPDGTPPVDMGKVLKRMRRYTAIIIVLIVGAILVFNALYTLNDGEEAAVTRFGEYVRTESNSGLQFKLPFVEDKRIVSVTEVHRMEFGFKMENGVYKDVTSEAIMLTQEENLVNADWVIQFQIVNSYNYFFKVQKPEDTLHTITQAAYRRVTAAHPLDDILTNRKDDMQREIRTDLQEICDKYEMGIRIIAVQLQDASPPDPVRDAFLDVTRALEDKNAKINQARTYENERLPLARGEAAAAVNEAEAYKERRVNEATGGVARYKAIEEEYRHQPDIMRTRLYLEMIREVLPRIEKVYFVDPSSGNLLEILPLGGLTQ